jgi:FtsH-binding integral membrane protein
MSNVSQSEPALTTSTITSVVAAAITLLVAFGLSLSETQTVAITGFVAVVAPLVSGFFTRKQVTPSKEVAVQATPSGDLVAGDALVTVDNGTVVEVVPTI